VNDMDEQQQQQQQQQSAGFTGRGFGVDDAGLDGEEYNEHGSDPLIAGDAPKKKNTAPLVLILVVGLAIGSLFSMHTVTKINAGQKGNSEAEQIIDHFVKTMSADGSTEGETVEGLVEGHREVLEVLRENYTDQQVANLERDPFFPEGGGAGTTGTGPVATYDYNAAADKLSVKMIIMGTTPLANVNGRIVKTNGAVMVALPNKTQVKFRVVEITADTVTVEAEGGDPEKPFRKTLHLNKPGR